MSIAAYLSRRREVDLKQALESATGILARRTAPVQTTEDDCLPREYRDMAEYDAVRRGHCAMDVKKPPQ